MSRVTIETSSAKNLAALLVAFIDCKISNVILPVFTRPKKLRPELSVTCQDALRSRKGFQERTTTCDTFENATLPVVRERQLCHDLSLVEEDSAESLFAEPDSRSSYSHQHHDIADQDSRSLEPNEKHNPLSCVKTPWLLKGSEDSIFIGIDFGTTYTGVTYVPSAKPCFYTSYTFNCDFSADGVIDDTDTPLPKSLPQITWTEKRCRNKPYIIVYHDGRLSSPRLTESLVSFPRDHPRKLRVKDWQNAYGKVGREKCFDRRL